MGRKGPPGDNGDRGPKGIMGLKGEMGDNGTMGDQGPPGSPALAGHYNIPSFNAAPLLSQDQRVTWEIKVSRETWEKMELKET